MCCTYCTFLIIIIMHCPVKLTTLVELYTRLLYVFISIYVVHTLTVVNDMVKDWIQLLSN